MLNTSFTFLPPLKNCEANEILPSQTLFYDLCDELAGQLQFNTFLKFMIMGVKQHFIKSENIAKVYLYIGAYISMELKSIWVVLFYSRLVSSYRTFHHFSITRTNSNHTTIIIPL